MVVEEEQSKNYNLLVGGSLITKPRKLKTTAATVDEIYLAVTNLPGLRHHADHTSQRSLVLYYDDPDFEQMVELIDIDDLPQTYRLEVEHAPIEESFDEADLPPPPEDNASEASEEEDPNAYSLLISGAHMATQRKLKASVSTVEELYAAVANCLGTDKEFVLHYDVSTFNASAQPGELFILPGRCKQRGLKCAMRHPVPPMARS